MVKDGLRRWVALVPFYYGWLIVGIAFVTMAIGVTARTAFSLLLPPLIDEFSWDRGLAAGAFSFGFLVSAVMSPIVGRVMDRAGPRLVIESGVALMSAGLLLAPAVANPWQLYATLGVAGGRRRQYDDLHRPFAVPAELVRAPARPRHQHRVRRRRRGGHRAAAMAANHHSPERLAGIVLRHGTARAARASRHSICSCGKTGRRTSDRMPDGDSRRGRGTSGADRRTSSIPPGRPSNGRSRGRCGPARFWWIVLGYFWRSIAWYAVQVHQTKYLVEVGFTPLVAAWALGVVSVIAIPGQILLGALSDRIGREWVWTAGCAGFAVSYAALIALEHAPSKVLLYVMVISAGLFRLCADLGDGTDRRRDFRGPALWLDIRHHHRPVDPAAAPPDRGFAGVIHDATGSYRMAFLLAIGCCLVSAAAIWVAGPRKVRLVPGRISRG